MPPPSESAGNSEGMFVAVQPLVSSAGTRSAPMHGVEGTAREQGWKVATEAYQPRVELNTRRCRRRPRLCKPEWRGSRAWWTREDACRIACKR